MKTFSLVVLAALFFSASSFAAQCENYAKYAAARSFIGQTSADKNNLSFKASFEGMINGAEQYDIYVEAPCVVEGDDSNCSMEFSVLVNPVGAKCTVLSLKELKQ